VGNTINKPFEKSKQDVCLTRNKLPVNFLFMNDEAKRVEQAFRALGMEAPEFQRKVGIQSQHWNNWRTRGIPKDKLPIVSVVIHRSTDWILTGQEASEGQAHGIQGQLDDVEGNIEVQVIRREIAGERQASRAVRDIDIAGLMPHASPATQDILQTLERGLQEGRLNEGDIKLLETIAKRLIDDQSRKNR